MISCMYVSVLHFHVEQDLRFDDRARKELLLRTEECRSRLWLDIEEREACAAGMLRTHKEDGQQNVLPHSDASGWHVITYHKCISRRRFSTRRCFVLSARYLV